MAVWRQDQIEFELVANDSDHPVVTLSIDCPVGKLLVMAEIVRPGRSLMLEGLHVHGDRAGPNAIGPANLAVIVRALMEVLDLDEFVVTGGLRTTGANPGRAPRQWRFTRRGSA